MVCTFLDIFRGEEYILTFPVLVAAYFWGRDIVREGSYIGGHLSTVTAAILTAIKLFIFSEVMFFSGFFASLFYTIFSGEVCCGITFPAQKALAIDPYRVPLLNTALLLSSRVTVT